MQRKKINPIAKILSSFYNEQIEDICTRILYFFNSLNSYFLFAGILSFIIAFPEKANILSIILAVSFVLITVRVSDAYPLFMILVIPAFFILGFLLPIGAPAIGKLLFLNCAIFFITQFLFMGIPDAIVSRDMCVPFLKFFNSLFTIAPTTVSFPVSIFFTFYLSFFLKASLICQSNFDYLVLIFVSLWILCAALITRCTLPKNQFSKFYKPDIGKAYFKRIVLLNIDGVRKDIFDSLHLPCISNIEQEGASHRFGLETVYLALTNPAFASILTGTTPKHHGVYNNNFGQSIKTEGLGDIVPFIAYGSMHVKHFCKKYWQTRIVSLPRYSIYHSDDLMLDWLKNDLLNRPEIRLFVADFSEADFLAHAYGSTSSQYKEALRRTDKRIGELLAWMKTNNMMDDTAVIICSDHGISAIDHSYLIARSERFVPFLIYGKGIKKGFQITRPGKIMDICCTVSYLLGVRYPYDARGQVFTEVLENSNPDAEKEALVTRFNQLKYDMEAKRYKEKHMEIYCGDRVWWDNSILEFVKDKKLNPRVLDFGCGSGFIGERFQNAGIKFKEFVCLDNSKEMLASARRELDGFKNFSFVSDLKEINGKFDVITVSSVFHHLYDPSKIAGVIHNLLDSGGLIFGSHEPNKRAFRGKLFNLCALIYKRLGAGVSIDDEEVDVFNSLLRQKYPHAPRVCREEILQMAEYHSPLEQYDNDVDKGGGFIPEEFLKSYFPDYETLLLEDYTTFFCRPWLTAHIKMQQTLKVLFNFFIREGNLFRFILQKP
jgi:2-polyprenyl-3-methyl-5-hydroxy-6-metoxy-1,4-benzoquinol methylase